MRIDITREGLRICFSVSHMVEQLKRLFPFADPDRVRLDFVLVNMSQIDKSCKSFVITAHKKHFVFTLLSYASFMYTVTHVYIYIVVVHAWQ